MRNDSPIMLHVNSLSLRYLLLRPARGKLPKADVRRWKPKRNNDPPLYLSRHQHPRDTSLFPSC